jgi:hypothetical protein
LARPTAIAATTAFATTSYVCAPGIGNVSVGLSQTFNMPRLLLESGNVVASSVVGMGGADQISNVRVRFRKWFTN